MNSTNISASQSTLSISDVIYVVQGTGMCLGNGLIVLAIASSKQLRNRKEMLLVAGLAVADFVYGIGTLLAGAIRIALTVRRERNDLITPWDCWWSFPPTPLFTVGQQTVGLMLVVLSIDRYIAVTHFALYRSLGKSYAYKVLCSVLTYGIFVIVTFFFVSFFLTDRVADQQRVCIGPISAPPLFGTIDSGLSSFYGYLSVAIYCAVYYQFRKHSKTSVHAQDQTDTTRTRQLALQRRVTVTLGIVTIFTFVFFCTPIAIVSLSGYLNFTISTTIIYTLTRVNSIVNIFIYVARQKEVRHAISDLITCYRWNFKQQNASVQQMPQA